MSESKIGKNTLYLYLRSFFILLVSLYTARVIIDKLGADDYGIFNTVAAVTASLSFLSSSLALATSRYITYDLGTGDLMKLKNTFQNLLSLYAILSIIVLVCLELVGPWFINNKLVFDDSRVLAINVVFHISVIMTLSTMVQTPFTSLIIAHEDMNVFAFVGVFEALAKLAICYLIATTTLDKLIFYSLLLLLVQLVLLFFNVTYSKLHYGEAIINFKIQKDKIKSIGSFAGWSLVGRFANVLQIQGTNIITNMFFGPAVVASRAISIQVNSALNTFVSNFMMAVNPQILKRHASGNDDSSNALVQKSTILSFVLASIICFPILVNAEYVLNLWLTDVPQYTIPFVQIILIQSIFSTIENGMYSVLYAHGRVKENAIVSPNLDISMFIVTYVLFKNGASPIALSYCFLVSCLLSCFVVKPYLIHRFIGHQIDFFLYIDKKCMAFFVSMVPLYLIHLELDMPISFSAFIIESFFDIIYLSAVAYFTVLDQELRNRVLVAFKKIVKKIDELCLY